MDAGFAAEGIDGESRIVGQGGHPGGAGGGVGLEPGIGDEGGAGLFRFR